jgi:hypothetical protein
MRQPAPGRCSTAHARCACLQVCPHATGQRALLRQFDAEMSPDLVMEEDAVQRSNGSQRTAPPNESAISRTAHVGEESAAAPPLLHITLRVPQCRAHGPVSAQ